MEFKLRVTASTQASNDFGLDKVADAADAGAAGVAVAEPELNGAE